MSEVLRHNGINGWDECRARKVPCPLGGTHITQEVVTSLETIEKPVVNHYSKYSIQHDEEILISKAVTAQLLESYKEHGRVGYEIKKLKENKNNTSSPEETVNVNRALNNAIQREKKIQKGIDQARNSLNNHRLSERHHLERLISEGKYLHTKEQVFNNTQMKYQHLQNHFNTMFTARFENKAPEISTNEVKEFFKGDPTLNNTFKTHVVGNTPVETYNNAIQEMYVQVNTRDYEYKEQFHTRISNEIEKVEHEPAYKVQETTQFLREQLYRNAFAIHTQQLEVIKNDKGNGFLSKRQLKQLHKQKGVELTAFFEKLNNSPYDTKIE